MGGARRFKLIGLTGGAGSGKSTVAQIFKSWGAEVIDADRIGHALLLPGSPCHDEVVRAFGPGIRYANGRIDRGALGALVFADARTMRLLNAIVHPHLLAEIAFQALKLRRAGKAALAVIDAALIVQWNLHRKLDGLVVVDAPERTRLARLAAAGVPAERARRIMALQLPAVRLRRAADIVIENDGGLAGLRRQAKTAWERIAAMP
ncbi:MAG: dephospho-CoA kinase [Candidatus Edwardsbacteria bacterium]|jgi:dephospho-CoA kinase|nr:dephospho-CoA kinase [Candidatus Edwardsbacteria bacterium]